jgi:hypothetical protein
MLCDVTTYKSVILIFTVRKTNILVFKRKLIAETIFQLQYGSEVSNFPPFKLHPF